MLAMRSTAVTMGCCASSEEKGSVRNRTAAPSVIYLIFFPSLAAFVALKAFAHLSFCIILDGLMRLELRFAALAMAECDGCKFHYLENSFRHVIQLYRSNIPSASGSILVSPIASLLSLMADFRVSA